MTIEENIKALILSRYRSIRDFVSHTELSYSTVDSILRRGICNSSLSSIIKLCNALDSNDCVTVDSSKSIAINMGQDPKIYVKQ